MQRHFALLSVGVLCVAALTGASRSTGDDARDLQGTWKFIGLEANGEAKQADEFEGWTLTFKEDELWVEKPGGRDPKLKFKLDAAKEPKKIDLTVLEGDDKGKVVPGIYAFSDGKLRLCINIFGDPTVRPKEFKTQEQDGVGFATLERIKGE